MGKELAGSTLKGIVAIGAIDIIDTIGTIVRKAHQLEFSRAIDIIGTIVKKKCFTRNNFTKQEIKNTENEMVDYNNNLDIGTDC